MRLSLIVVVLIVFACSWGCSYVPSDVKDVFTFDDEPESVAKADDQKSLVERVEEAGRADEPPKLDRNTVSVGPADSSEETGQGLLALVEDVCIGGDKCPGPKRENLVLSMEGTVFVEKIIFHADDYIGRKHDGRIRIFLDRTLIEDDIDIKKRGARHEIKVEKTGHNVIVQSEADDEVQFQYIRVYGERLPAGQTP